ncbi:MAG: diguanylate cyclase domain-containing protein [Gemmatimonadales bacterium]
MPEQLTRPRVLLLGEAAARPEGLERELTRAGFQLLEQEDPDLRPASDAILITLSRLGPGNGLIPGYAVNHGSTPQVVVLSGPDPDGPATALARGAADALMTPVHLPELCARIYARIREHRQSGQSATPASEFGLAPASNGGAAEGTLPTQPSQDLEQRVQEEFERARRYSLSFSLILLGVDELQDSEQRQGPEAAARLREEVTQTLRRELRVPDLVAPYGSGEFAIVLPETGQSGARQSLIRVRERLTSLPFEGDPRFGSARFSAGIVTFPHPAAFQPDDLFAMAEAALMRGRAQSSERIGVAV